MKLDKETKDAVKVFQKNEITEYHVYSYLANMVKGRNGRILQGIANDERNHYNRWKKYSKEEVKPDKLKILWYSFLAKTAGFTFAVRLMEKGEDRAQHAYAKIVAKLPEARDIQKQEHKHEKKLINMLNEEKMTYISSVILGLNDALVELTGAIAGLTFAFQNTNLISIAALVTGIAASMSMAASEYLARKAEKSKKNPLKAATYTGFAYISAVLILVFPFFVLTNPYYALVWTLSNAILIIACFSYFVSITRDSSFKRGFLEMALLSLGVAAISFVIGVILRNTLGIGI